MRGSETTSVASGTCRRKYLVTKAAQKVTVSPSRDIRIDKLVLSQSNARRIKAGVSVAELAEDNASCGMLQSLSAQPAFDNQADGQRFQLLSRLVKQMWVAETASIPCIERDATPEKYEKGSI